jgi:hypothetical protein
VRQRARSLLVQDFPIGHDSGTATLAHSHTRKRRLIRGLPGSDGRRRPFAWLDQGARHFPVRCLCRNRPACSRPPGSHSNFVGDSIPRTGGSLEADSSVANHPTSARDTQIRLSHGGAYTRMGCGEVGARAADQSHRAVPVPPVCHVA